jgi:fructose transport system substrate-binding protein
VRHRSLLCPLAAATLAVTASGCTVERHWGGSASPGGGGKAKIGLVTKTNTNPYFVEVRNAASAAAKTAGADFVALAGQFDGDNDGQVRAIENLMQQGATTILITPTAPPACSTRSTGRARPGSW